MDFSLYKLKDNPFRIGPSMNSDELIWAGMSNLKNIIDKRIEAGIKTSPSRIVLNWGRYGSGKTHAANYYTRTNHIKNTFKVATKNIKVYLPRSSKEPVQAFLRALVGQMNFDNIIEDFQNFKTVYKDRTESIIEMSTQDTIISQFLKLFIGRKIDKSATLFEGSNEEMVIPAKKEALRSYLYGDDTKPVLKELNLPLGLNEDDEQVVNLISGIFNVISFEKNLYKSIYLWIDEFEDIDTLPRTSQERFTTFLRQLIDKTPNNLNIFLNFTLKGTRESEDLSILLGEALKSRVQLSIEFEEPSVEEAQQYVAELINHPKYRETDTVNDPIYPFNSQSLNYVLSNVDRLSMRKINETFSLLLELALTTDPIPPIIDKAFIDKVKSEIPSWKKT